MSKKTILIISYITIIGWVISFVVYNKGGRSTLAQYHLKQSLGLGVLGALISIIYVIIIPIDISISILFMILGLSILVFLILGINNAVNQNKKPIPMIGFMFVDRFSFIKF